MLTPGESFEPPPPAVSGPGTSSPVDPEYRDGDIGEPPPVTTPPPHTPKEPPQAMGVHGGSGDYLFAPMLPDEAYRQAVVEVMGSETAERLLGPARPLLARIVPEFHAQDLELRWQRTRQDQLGLADGIDQADLAQAGWAVVFPAARVEELRQALEPLLALRRRQAGRLFREFLYQGEDKLLFLAQHGAGVGQVDPTKVPYYVLLVGSLEEISFEFQYQLDVPHAVGRLCFSGRQELARLRRYALSVVAAESGNATRRRKVSIFGPRIEGDSGTEKTHDLLVEPLAKALRKQQGPAELAGWQFEDALGDQAEKARLRALFADPELAFLFAATHGIGFDHDDQRQRGQQGSLLCQGWGGPASALGEDSTFSAQDLHAELPDEGKGPGPLCGLIAMLFACFSAGTPARNNFHFRGTKEREILAAASFMAPLAEALLDQGALAVIGHIDRAWTYSFYWPLAGAQLTVFKDSLSRLLAGNCAGYAMEPFNDRYAELATDVMARPLGLGAPPLLHPAALWTALLDARNYVLLGDPAVRLAPAVTKVGSARY